MSQYESIANPDLDQSLLAAEQVAQLLAAGLAQLQSRHSRALHHFNRANWRYLGALALSPEAPDLVEVEQDYRQAKAELDQLTDRLNQLSDQLPVGPSEELVDRLARRRSGELQGHSQSLESSPELDDVSQSSVPSRPGSDSVIGRTLRLVESTTGSLKIGDVLAAFDAADGLIPTYDRVGTSLTQLAKDERIKRIDRGVYANLDFDEVDYQPPPKNLTPGSLRARVLRAVESASQQPLRPIEVAAALKLDGGPSFETETVYLTLVELKAAGIIGKLYRGAYVSLDFDEAKWQSATGPDESDRHPAAKYLRSGTINARLLKVIEAANQPLEIGDALAAVNADGGPASTRGRVRDRLSGLARQGIIERPSPGVYARRGL